MMEAAELEFEPTCLLCKERYTDPVTLQCGDSFCRVCIDYVLERHLVFGDHSCPQCNMKIKELPLFPNSTQVLNAIQTYQAAKRGEGRKEEVKVYCLYCEESEVPAVKTCVQCETPLCEQHLEAHNKERTHILIPPTPTASLAYRKCREHKKPLLYYCSQDAACICECCSLTGNHQGHGVMSVMDAFTTENSKLRNYLHNLKLREERIDERLQSLAEVTSKVRQKAIVLRNKINELFKKMRKQLTHLQKSTKESLYKELQKMAQPELTRRWHKQKETLSRKIRHVGELCDVTDPVTLLQKVELREDLLRDDPDEETEQNDDPIPSIDLNEESIKAPLLSGLSQLVNVYKEYGSNVSQDVNSDEDMDVM